VFATLAIGLEFYFDCSHHYLGNFFPLFLFSSFLLFFFFSFFPLGNYTVHRAGTPNLSTFSGKVLEMVHMAVLVFVGEQWEEGSGLILKLLDVSVMCMYVYVCVCIMSIYVLERIPQVLIHMGTYVQSGSNEERG